MAGCGELADCSAKFRAGVGAADAQQVQSRGGSSIQKWWLNQIVESQILKQNKI